MKSNIKNNVRLIIKGNPVRKSNNRIGVMTRGPKRFIKGKRAAAYYKSFDEQVPDEARIGMKGPVTIVGQLFYSPVRVYRKPKERVVRAKISNAEEAVNHSWVGDLSVEAIMDCLQRSGVIEDDRQVVSICVYKAISFDDPRIDIVVNELYESKMEFEPPEAADSPIPVNDSGKGARKAR